MPLIVFPTIKHITNKRKSTATIVDPTGVPAKRETRIPINAQITDEIAEKIVTILKFLKIYIADIAGKIISAEINKEPTKFIAKTIITAIKIAITRLYKKTFVPDAVAKSSSKVIEKILL